MAKDPETIERFILHVPVTAEQLGPVVVMLSRMGLDNLRHELITDVVTFRNKQQHEVNAADFVTPWLEQHPTFKAIELVQHFEAHGRSRSSAYPAIDDLLKQKRIKRVSIGQYAVNSQKPSAVPKHAKAARREVSHRDFILRLASRNHGRFNTSWMKKQFEKDKRTPGNVSPSVSKLVEKKLLKRVGDAEYVLLARAAKKASKPVIKGNGAAAAEAAHG